MPADTPRRHAPEHRRRMDASPEFGGTGWYLSTKGDRIEDLAAERGWHAIVLPLNSTYLRSGWQRYQAFKLAGRLKIRLTGVATLPMAVNAARSHARRCISDDSSRGGER